MEWLWHFPFVLFKVQVLTCALSKGTAIPTFIKRTLSVPRLNWDKSPCQSTLIMSLIKLKSQMGYSYTDTEGTKGTHIVCFLLFCFQLYPLTTTSGWAHFLWGRMKSIGSNNSCDREHHYGLYVAGRWACSHECKDMTLFSFAAVGGVRYHHHHHRRHQHHNGGPWGWMSMVMVPIYVLLHLHWKMSILDPPQPPLASPAQLKERSPTA